MLQCFSVFLSQRAALESSISLYPKRVFLVRDHLCARATGHSSPSSLPQGYSPSGFPNRNFALAVAIAVGSSFSLHHVVPFY